LRASVYRNILNNLYPSTAPQSMDYFHLETIFLVSET
jgi:hypothetical protein